MEVHTSQRARHLLSTVVPSDISTVPAHELIARKGQKLASVVCESLVHPHQAFVRGEVAQFARQLFVRGIHLAHVDEGCQGVELLTHVGASEDVTGVASSASRSRTEEGDAFVRVPSKAGVIGRKLYKKEDLGIFRN